MKNHYAFSVSIKEVNNAVKDILTNITPIISLNRLTPDICFPTSIYTRKTALTMLSKTVIAIYNDKYTTINNDIKIDYAKINLYISEFIDI